MDEGEVGLSLCNNSVVKFDSLAIFSPISVRVRQVTICHLDFIE